MKKHRSLAAVILFFMVATKLGADEKPGNEPVRLPPNDSVRWMPNRNVKDSILKEIDRFGKDMKAKLGPKTLAFKPYIAVNDSPEAAAVASRTVEQMLVDSAADHGNSLSRTQPLTWESATYLCPRRTRYSLPRH